jgi:acyl-CoA synthetase (AMP-forming)/AMP-acid ligase II
MFFLPAETVRDARCYGEARVDGVGKVLPPEELGMIAVRQAPAGGVQRPGEIEWVTEMPMTVSGKINRAELRQRQRVAQEA